jgi:hypothetical protein
VYEAASTGNLPLVTFMIKLLEKRGGMWSSVSGSLRRSSVLIAAYG